jgi:hypothetical protein
MRAHGGGGTRAALKLVASLTKQREPRRAVALLPPRHAGSGAGAGAGAGAAFLDPLFACDGVSEYEYSYSYSSDGAGAEPPLGWSSLLPLLPEYPYSYSSSPPSSAEYSYSLRPRDPSAGVRRVPVRWRGVRVRRTTRNNHRRPRACRWQLL